MSRFSKRIIYLDGFAGPGIYEGGKEGSPVIALRTATEHKLKDRFNEIIFIFIEKKRKRAEKLKQVLSERFPNLPKNIKYHVIGAEFAPTLENVLEDIKSNNAELAPTLAFLDPFGFSGLPMELLGQMMKYSKCEILVTFMVNFLRRFHDEYRKSALNQLFATDEWKKIDEIQDPDEKIRFFLKLYEKQLIRVCGAKYVKNFCMSGKNGQPIYYLVFATKNVKGLEVMKNSMYKVDRRGTYKFSDSIDENQTYIFEFGNPKTNGLIKASNKVYNQFKGQTVSESIVKHFVITETDYVNHRPILKYLEGDCEPSKIVDVTGRSKKLCYPEGSVITFSS